MTTVLGAYGYQLTAPGTPLQPYKFPALDPGADEVAVQVAGCGVCHTDVGFVFDGVPTRHSLPLVLGHEISVVVPARGLCAVPENLPPGLSLEMLSVVADAVTTPYEAIRRAGVGPEDVAVIIGAGGIGSFGVQISAALGAAVVAIDIDHERLKRIARHGAGLALNARTADLKGIKGAIRAFTKESGRKGMGLKIFEMSGTPAGQTTAFGLLDHGAYLAVVGFTAKPVELRLSNLMAFDATARGNWGCPPDQYPNALRLVLEGKISLAPFTEQHPLEEAPAILEAAARHELPRRVILRPNHGNGKRKPEGA